MEKTKVPCPVCAHPAFLEGDFPGSYCICPKCGWEDDDLQYYNKDFAGGANDMSLQDAIKNFKLYGIINPK